MEEIVANLFFQKDEHNFMLDVSKIKDIYKTVHEKDQTNNPKKLIDIFE